jgi:hypothetical protein
MKYSGYPAATAAGALPRRFERLKNRLKNVRCQIIGQWGEAGLTR